MRQNDLKLQAIAKEVGMIYLKNGIEYSIPVTVNDLTMEFAYETPDEVAYIEVYQEGRRKPINVYMGDFEEVRNDFPQFFQD